MNLTTFLFTLVAMISPTHPGYDNLIASHLTPLIHVSLEVGSEAHCEAQRQEFDQFMTTAGVQYQIIRTGCEKFTYPSSRVSNG